MSKTETKETEMTTTQLFQAMQKMNDVIATSTNDKDIATARRLVNKYSAQLSKRGW